MFCTHCCVLLLVTKAKTSHTPNPWKELHPRRSWIPSCSPTGVLIADQPSSLLESIVYGAIFRRWAERVLIAFTCNKQYFFLFFLCGMWRCFCVFQTRSCSIVQASLILVILQPQCPEWWVYMCAPLCLASNRHIIWELIYPQNDQMRKRGHSLFF